MSVFQELPTHVVVSIETAVASTVTDERKADFETRLRNGDLNSDETATLLAILRRIAKAQHPKGIDQRKIAGVESFEVNPLNEATLLVTVILGEQDSFPIM